MNFPTEGLCFVGLVSLIDPPRVGVNEPRGLGTVLRDESRAQGRLRKQKHYLPTENILLFGERLRCHAATPLSNSPHSFNFRIFPCTFFLSCYKELPPQPHATIVYILCPFLSQASFFSIKTLSNSIMVSMYLSSQALPPWYTGLFLRPSRCARRPVSARAFP